MKTNVLRVAQRCLTLTGLAFSVLLVTGCVGPLPNNQSSGSVYTTPARRIYTPVQRIYTPTAPKVIYKSVPSPTVVVPPARIYKRETTIYRNTYNRLPAKSSSTHHEHEEYDHDNRYGTKERKSKKHDD